MKLLCPCLGERPFHQEFLRNYGHKQSKWMKLLCPHNQLFKGGTVLPLVRLLIHDVWATLMEEVDDKNEQVDEVARQAKCRLRSALS